MIIYTCFINCLCVCVCIYLYLELTLPGTSSLQFESSSSHPAPQSLAMFGRESEREEGKRETWIFQCGLSRDENDGIISYTGITHP